MGSRRTAGVSAFYLPGVSVTSVEKPFSRKEDARCEKRKERIDRPCELNNLFSSLAD